MITKEEFNMVHVKKQTELFNKADCKRIGA